MNMTISEFMQKAERSYEAAQLLHNHGMYDFSVGRSYYSMFYAASALLLSKGLSYSKHSGVISAFGSEFAKTGLISQDLHRSFAQAFDFRSKGDYGAITLMDAVISSSSLVNARKFIDTASEYLVSL